MSSSTRKRMKIIFLSFYSGFVDRGVETFVHELAKRLTKKHKVLVIKGDSKSPSIFYLTLKNLPTLFKFKPDVIIPTNGGWQSLLIKLYTLFNKSKIVISGQAGLGRDDKWNLLLKPKAFVALSKRNARWAKRFTKRVKIASIPNGVDLKKFMPRSDLCKRAEVGPFQKKLPKPIILCVAGHERFKRVEETIKAVALLKRGSLLVVGGSKETKSVGKKLLKNRFSQLKFPHKKMPQVYKSADLFTLVSESSEAFGISYLEAMACGVPVVATDDELRREIISKAGLFIKNPENSKMYAEFLKKALKKDWKNLPRKQAERFSWDRVAKSYEELLEDLI